MCRATAFFTINLKPDGSVMCRAFSGVKGKAVKVQRITSPAWHMYVCVLDVGDGITSYFNGEFEANVPASTSSITDWTTLHQGAIDRIKVAEISGDPIIEVSQAYVFARALGGAEVKAMYEAMNTIQGQSGCGKPIARPFCGMFSVTEIDMS